MRPRPVLAEDVRAHERLVVEAGAEQRREAVVDRTHVEFERRPAVLAQSRKAFMKLDLRRAQIGRKSAGSARNADQRVGLLRASAYNSSRPMILIRAPDQMNAVGDERGGERIACVALVGDAVEGEGERARAVDQAEAGDAKGLAHVLGPAR